MNALSSINVFYYDGTSDICDIAISINGYVQIMIISTYSLRWGQVDTIRTLFVHPNDETLSTFQLAESV